MKKNRSFGIEKKHEQKISPLLNGKKAKEPNSKVLLNMSK